MDQRLRPLFSKERVAMVCYDKERDKLKDYAIFRSMSFLDRLLWF